MSHLTLSTGNFGTFQMNVLSFNSPIFGTIIPVQTKTIAQFFPVKANQPEIQFTVIFRNQAEYERFQRYIRAHQVAALTSTSPQVTLNWPARNINNWTGVIKEFRAGGMRRNYAPRATFIVDLIDSMVSIQTFFSSTGTSYNNVAGQTLGLSDALLRAPTLNMNSTSPYSYSNNPTSRGFVTPVGG